MCGSRVGRADSQIGGRYYRFVLGVQHAHPKLVVLRRGVAASIRRQPRNHDRRHALRPHPAHPSVGIDPDLGIERTARPHAVGIGHQHLFPCRAAIAARRKHSIVVGVFAGGRASIPRAPEPSVHRRRGERRNPLMPARGERMAGIDRTQLRHRCPRRRGKRAERHADGKRKHRPGGK